MKRELIYPSWTFLNNPSKFRCLKCFKHNLTASFSRYDMYNDRDWETVKESEIPRSWINQILKLKLAPQAKSGTILMYRHGTFYRVVSLIYTDKSTTPFAMNLSGNVSNSLSFRRPACNSSVMLVSSRPPYTLNSFKLQTCTLWYFPNVIVPIKWWMLYD